jgi:hypothetical protein
MADVFSGGQVFAGAFKAGDLKMSIGGVPLAGAMVQSIQYQFNQQLNQFFELGSPSVFFVAGRAQGNLTISKLAAAKGLQLAISNFNDVCNPKDLGFSSESSGCKVGTGDALGTNYEVTFKQCVLTGVTGQADAQSVVVTHGLTMQFVNMQVPDDF